MPGMPSTPLAVEIGAKLRHRERVVGTHFWNPPHLVPLVEVVQSDWTSAETVQKTIDLAREVTPAEMSSSVSFAYRSRLSSARTPFPGSSRYITPR